MGVAEETLSRNPASERMDLAFDGIRMTIFSNSASLLEKLKRYFDGFIVSGTGREGIRIYAIDGPAPEFPGESLTIKQPDPGKTRIKEEYIEFADGRVVRKRLTGMVFAFGPGLNLAVGPSLDNDNQVVNFINSRFIQAELSAGSLLAHAAGVAAGGRGLAVAGFSGMGKSTLALHLLGHGLDFISNDRLMVRREGNVAVMKGVAKLPRINPGTALNNEKLKAVMTPEDRDRFSSLGPDELWRLEHKYDVFIDDLYGKGRFTLAGVMSSLVILNWSRGVESFDARRVDPRERRDLLAAFMKSAGLFYLPDGDGSDTPPSEEQYLDVLERTDVYEITGGVDFDQATGVCLDILGGQ
ncbi:MAG: HprK-related kinase B [Nitrospinae bacterium]|nr:HprK-related kinase B [Nitrospinota bacterium]